MSIVSIRGAITVDTNNKEAIINSSKVLLQNIIEKNLIDIKNVISILFSATDDLNKIYPAAAARELGFTQCGLMCLQEMKVENSLKKCIRVLMLVKSDKLQSEISHIYLKDAKVLRPDLV